MRLFGRSIIALMLAAGLSACATTKEEAAGPPMPLSPQPTAMQPGLAPVYILGEMESIIYVPTGAKADAAGRPGKPVANLDVTSSGELWESGTRRHYGVLFRGMIKLEAGTYAFQALSNDGVKIMIDRAVVVDDPDVHADRMSPKTSVTFTQAGWYPLQVQYFQKNGSATLRFYWQPPGAPEAVVVPPAALAHLPK